MYCLQDLDPRDIGRSAASPCQAGCTRLPDGTPCRAGPALAMLAHAALLLLALPSPLLGATGDFDPYPVLWSSNSVSPSALTAAGIRQRRVRNWSAHDSPASYCTRPVTTGGDGGNCIRGKWPLITATGNINGGVPQAANLTAHLEEVRRTLPLGVPSNYTGLASIE